MLKVTKFGGSSVADAKQFKKVKNIIQSDPQRRYVIVSAPGRRYKNDAKVTDLLYLLDAHRQYHVDASNIFSLIKKRFLEIKEQLHLKQPIEAELDSFYVHLNQMNQNEIVSRGEYFCDKLMAEYLGFPFMDAIEVIRFHLDKTLDQETTRKKLNIAITQKKCFVLPGFYGAASNDKIQVFSRGGGDITGAIVANAIHANIYENWTDVSGFLMADPTVVANPKPITHITYSELRELSYMGASVLHEEAIFPVKESNIPIHILNTNQPWNPGTIIQERTEAISPYAITGIAGKSGFLSVYIYKKHMSNEIGYMRKVLSIFEEYHVSIEHIPSGIDSFSVVLQEKDVEDQLYEILARIKKELRPDTIKVKENIALISTVGKNMSGKPGISGKLFGALGKNNISIIMIAQGSDEINITVGVNQEDFKKTIQVIYDTFVVEEEKQ